MQSGRLSTMFGGVTGSRRGMLRVAGAGIVASVVSHRFGMPALAQDPFTTRVMVLHAAPGLGQVEVLFNGDELLDEFDYGQTSDWLDIDPGSVRVTVRRDRFGINYPVFDAVYPVAVGNDYTLIISNPIVIPTAVDREPLPADTSRVRVVHASVDTPAIDVAVAGGDVAVEDLSYGQLSDPIEVPAGTVDMEVRVNETGEVLLDLPGGIFEPGTTYEAILYGTPGSSDAPLTVTWLTDTVREGEPTGTPTA